MELKSSRKIFRLDTIRLILELKGAMYIEIFNIAMLLTILTPIILQNEFHRLSFKK